MNIVIKESETNTATQQLVATLYKAYAARLLAYTVKHYGINEDDAMSLVYKTIYRMAETSDRYSFANNYKLTGFVFKTHINYLRNYFRDNKSFEHTHREVELEEQESTRPDTTTGNFKLQLLQRQLDQLEEWQRMLLLLRSQDMPYSDIARFIDKPERQLKVYYARLKKQLLANMNNALNSLNHGKK